LEGVLDDWFVPEGSRLRDRLECFRKSVSAIEEKDRLLVDPIFRGLKKIGDLGSHAGDVGREDLVNAFEDIEIALGIIYGMKNEPAVARIKAQIKADVRRKRPRG